MKLPVLIAILTGVFLNVVAQLLLKVGANRLGEFALHWSTFPSTMCQIVTNAPILLGLFIYAISVIVWIFVLSRIDVSVAYPTISLGYILNAVAAYYLFGENLSLLRIAGIFVILIGVVMITRS